MRPDMTELPARRREAELPWPGVTAHPAGQLPGSPGGRPDPAHHRADGPMKGHLSGGRRQPPLFTAS